MKTGPLVSIVVPIYNMEAYLERAVQSLLCQTYETTEVLLINDGSTDGSGSICDRFAREYANVRVYHQANGGVCRARNAGIAAAEGAYLQFVDPDDYCEPEMTEQLLGALQAAKAQMAVCGIEYCRVSQNVVVDRQAKNMGVEGVFAGKTLMKLYCQADALTAGCIGHVCNKLYPVDLLNANQIRFREDIVVNEDDIFNMEVLAQCDRAAVFSRQLYHQHGYDRITGSTRYWEHAYEDSRLLFRLLRDSIGDELTGTEMKRFNQCYANKLITAAVILCRADRTLSDKALNEKIQAMLKDPDTKMALRDYRRLSPAHSRSLPIFMRLGWTSAVIRCAKRRAVARYGHLIHST